MASHEILPAVHKHLDTVAVSLLSVAKTAFAVSPREARLPPVARLTSEHCIDALRVGYHGLPSFGGQSEDLGCIVAGILHRVPSPPWVVSK